MHIFWEEKEWPGGKVDSGVKCLSWLPGPEGTEGLLSSGSQSGSVGITRTELKPRLDNPKTQKRLNYNLRGHHNAISIVSWNREQSKLATCDDSGIIYVWVPYEERWSVELVNDRGVKVRDFAWSPNGSAALICYEDNFVLIGSAQGQRIWSNVFQDPIHCGAWNPQSDQVILGSEQGKLRLLTEQGGALGEYELWKDKSIKLLAWSAQRSTDLKSTICVCFQEGVIHLMESCDDVDPVVVNTEMTVLNVEWTTNGEYLAVGGSVSAEGDKFVNQFRIYSPRGVQLLYSIIPFVTSKALSAFTWAYEDQCLVFSAEGEMSVGRVITEVPSLQILTSYKVWGLLSEPLASVPSLPVPSLEKSMLTLHNYHIIQCQIPTAQELCEAVCSPSGWRCYCTIQPVPKQPQTYMLCMEHMGGLVPILKGRQINKILPEFEIRLVTSESWGLKAEQRSSSAPRTANTEPSPRVNDEGSASARDPFTRSNFQRDSVWRRSKRQLEAFVRRTQQHAFSSSLNKKVQEEKLVQVSSNVWCTRFKILGIASQYLPPYLGQVIYKTSVLHLQPRQMTVQVVDLKKNSPAVPPPSESDIFSDGMDENLLKQHDEGPPVAPMDTEIFFEHARDARPAEAQSEDILLREQELLHQVLSEFNELRVAVDSHIRRMRDFATDLQSSSNLEAVNGRAESVATSRQAMESGLSRLVEMSRFQPSAAESTVEASNASGPSSSLQSFAQPESKGWERELEEIDFIDEDEAVLLTSETEIQRIRARALSYGGNRSSPMAGPAAFSTPTQRAGKRPSHRKPVRNFGGQRSASEQQTSTMAEQDIPGTSSGRGDGAAGFSRPNRGRQGSSTKQLKEITSVLDKLYKLANELTARAGVTDCATPSVSGTSGGTGGKIAPNSERVPALLMEADPGPYTELRTRIREIAQRVSQLERRINYGNELLDEVRSDLQRRVHRIKDVLGDRPSGEEKGLKGAGKKEDSGNDDSRVLVLQNKAPFWNEQSQVYQLDFGGRVTQESAKNFQIEHEETQVMQFGRIENGAYTLDFQGPFSAVQAFAVALASITQRLK